MYENMIVIDRRAPESLQKQIRRQIAIGILNRQYPLHQPLPSIRRLSADLEVSVTTVALAYEGLKQDGFVDARTRSGYFVNRDVLTDPGHAPKEEVATEVPRPAKIDYAEFFRDRSFNLQRVVKPSDCLVRFRYPFICGLIEPSLFPITSWRECVRDSVNVVEVGNWATDYSAIDDELLIEQLIQRVLAKRGIVAHPEEVLVTVGGQQALYLAMKLLLSPGEALGVEDPGYPDVINMATIEGITVRRLAIDRQGLILGSGVSRCKCLFVTPSHQFPTTVTMPLDRRLQLLKLTRTNHQFVIEDDYEADISFKQDASAGSEEPRRLGERHLYGQSLEIAAAGTAHRLPGGGSGVRPGGEGAAPPHAAAPPGQQPEKRGAVPATGLLRPVRREDHGNLPAAVRGDARVAGASLSGSVQKTGIWRRKHLAEAAGRGGRRDSA